jgi:hypothetical protein
MYGSYLIFSNSYLSSISYDNFHDLTNIVISNKLHTGLTEKISITPNKRNFCAAYVPVQFYWARVKFAIPAISVQHMFDFDNYFYSWTELLFER